MIKPLSLEKLAGVLQGQLSGDDQCFEGLSIDSRKVEKGQVYLALKGDRLDGHRFIGDAITKGCAGIIGEESADSIEGLTGPYLRVKNSKLALGKIASVNRDLFTGKLVALTGSAGKTSTKNMLSTVLSEFGATSATKGNFNNEIGVPLTLLDLESQHQFSVVELGARKAGDIAYLGEIVKPNIAMVLNAGSAHIEIFGSYEAIVEGKGEIYDALSATGIGILNFDDPAYLTWKERLGNRQYLSFSSESENADVYASEVRCDAKGCVFYLNYLEDKVLVHLPVPGLHQVQNALAASAAAIALGCDLVGIARGLEKVVSSEGRMNSSELGSIRVLDDSYNANPVSMKAALDVLAMQQGYRVAVLGEMGELGAYAYDAHLDVASHAAGSSIDQICLIGQYADAMSERIGDRAKVFQSKTLLANHLVDDEQEDKVVMVKGSRSAAMDEVVSLIERRVH